MALTSDQISQMTGGGQMQAMMGMQHAAMISQQAGSPFAATAGSGTTGEALMGRGVNMMAGMAPIAAGGMSLMGMDPISLGARGLFSGSAIGAGAGMIGGGVAAGGLMAAQYAAKQAMMGMQQQQQLNQALSQSFQFQGQTQRGFTLGESGDIGQMMRQASMQRGMGGEFTSMAELTTLASRMGQMGMARGVRDVRDFSEKFKQMLDTVKEVATAFNTNLEQAQQIMGSMRQSGIFRNQGQVAQQVRSWAMSGGLATQEVSQAMQMGSQYSRMIGGTGVAGAFGGMRTIGQIGAMQQMGLMSEEQVFNLTGQTGAAGQQALAQQQMGQAARFLQGGLGRRFIASLAAPGEGGEINEEAAEEYEAGGVGTGRTMQMAGAALGKVGRANFIRREGRLRGAALARFGAMAPIAVMSQWLEQRGTDPGGDKGLIFMSQRLGISVDEAEQQLKQFRMRDIIEQRQRRSGASEDAAMWARVEQQRGGQGIRGIKKSLEGFKHDVNSRIQQWGAEVYTEGSNVIERWINTVTGSFIQSIDRDVGGAIRDVLTGSGAYAQQVAESRFGLGRGLRGQALVEGARARVLQEAPSGYQQLGTLGAARAAGDTKRLGAAGWTSAAGARTNQAYENALQGMRGMQSAYVEGVGFRGLDAATREALLTRTARGEMEGEAVTPQTAERALLGILGGTAVQSIERAAGLGMRLGPKKPGQAPGRGEETAATFQYMLGSVGTEQSRELARRMRQSGTEGKFGLMGDISREAGLGFDWRVRPPELRGVPGGGFRTEMDRNEAIGRTMLGEVGVGATGAQRTRTAGRFVAAVTGVMGGPFANPITASAMLGPAGWFAKLPDLAGMVGRTVEDRARVNLGGMSTEVMRAAGSFLASEKGRAAAMGALSRDDATADATFRAVRERNITLLEKGGGLGGMTVAEKGEYEVGNSLMMVRDYAKLMASTKSAGGPTEAQKAVFLSTQRKGTTWTEVEGRSQAVLGAVGESQQQARRQLLERARERGEEALGGFREAGIIKGGRLTSMGADRFQKIGGKRGGETSAANLFIRATVGAAESQAGGFIETSMKQQEMATAALGMMTPEQMKATERELRGTGPGGEQARERIAGVRGITRQLQRGGGQGARGMANVGAVFGLDRKDLDVEDLAKRSPEEASRILTQQLGIDKGAAGGFQTDLKKALELQKRGKSEEAAVVMEGLRGGGAMAKADIAKQDDAAKKQDPSYRLLESIKTALEPLKDMPKKGDKQQVLFDQPIQVEDRTKEPED